MTALCDFGGMLGRPLDTFFWALTISWSRLLARVRNGPQVQRYLDFVHDGNGVSLVESYRP